MSTSVSLRLWNAIDDYVRACGGRPPAHGTISLTGNDCVREALIAVSHAVNAEILDHIKIRLEELLEDAEKAYTP